MPEFDNKIIIIIALIILLPVVFYLGIRCKKPEKQLKCDKKKKTSKENFEMDENFHINDDEIDNGEMHNVNFMQLSSTNNSVSSRNSVLRTRNGTKLISAMHILTKLGLIDNHSLFKNENPRELPNITRLEFERNINGGYDSILDYTDSSKPTHKITITNYGGSIKPSELCNGIAGPSIPRFQEFTDIIVGNRIIRTEIRDVQPPRDFVAVGSSCGLIGTGVSLKTLNIMDPDNIGRGAEKQIFVKALLDDYDNSCYAETGDNTKLEEISGSSTQEIVSSTSAAINLNGAYTQKSLAISGTLDSSTGGTINSTLRSQAYSFKMVKDVAHLNLSSSFQNNTDNIDPELIARLLDLDPIISDPSVPESWLQYDNFLTAFGDHIITSITFGASFNIWQSTDSYTEDVTQYLKIKACVDASAGDGSKAPGGSGCGSYDSSSRSHADSLNTTFRYYIGGGDRAIADQITNAYRSNPPNLPDGIVLAFLESASVPGNAKPIQFTFTPIWDFIASIHLPQYVNEIVYGRSKTPTPSSYKVLGRPVLYSASSITQICVNLQAAFVRNKIGCPILKTTNGITYQQFLATAPGKALTYYKCWAKKEGCNNDGDCHYQYVPAGCRAGGASAIIRGEEFMKIPNYPTQYRSTVRGSPDGGIYDGINGSCHQDWGCKCDGGWSGGLLDRDIWTSGQ